MTCKNVEEMHNFIRVDHTHDSVTLRTVDSIVQVLVVRRRINTVTHCVTRTCRLSTTRVLLPLFASLAIGGGGLWIFERFCFVDSTVHHKHGAILIVVGCVPNKTSGRKSIIIRKHGEITLGAFWKPLTVSTQQSHTSWAVENCVTGWKTRRFRLCVSLPL